MSEENKSRTSDEQDILDCAPNDAVEYSYPTGDCYGAYYKDNGNLVWCKESLGEWEHNTDKDYIGVQLKDLRSKVNYYTQENFNLKIPPVVGETVLVGKMDEASRLQDFSNKEVEVIGVSEVNGKTVLTFSHKQVGIGCGICSFDNGAFFPVKQLTQNEVSDKQLVQRLRHIYGETQNRAELLVRDLRNDGWLKEYTE